MKTVKHIVHENLIFRYEYDCVIEYLEDGSIARQYDANVIRTNLRNGKTANHF